LIGKSVEGISGRLGLYHPVDDKSGVGDVVHRAVLSGPGPLDTASETPHNQHNG
jgi:hypothetical protein